MYVLYDYRSDNITQDVVLENYNQLVYDIISECESLRRYDFLAVYCPAYIADMLMTSILHIKDDVVLDDDSDLDDLLSCEDNEVLMTINNEGLIILEEARGYYGDLKMADGVINYIHDSFSNKDVKKLSKDFKPLMVFGFEEE